MNTQEFNKKIEKIGDLLVEVFQPIGLFIIGATVVWSAAITRTFSA